MTADRGRSYASRRLGDPWHPRPRSALLLPAVLRIVDRLERPLRLAGVEPRSFRALLALRLDLDLRESSFVGAAAGGGTSFQVGLALIATGFWLAGMMPGLAAFFVEDPYLWMALCQGMVLGMVLMILLGHFATLLVDATDVDVVGPLPVPGRTLFAARLGHTFAYVGLLAGLFALWPTFLGCFRYPPWLVLTLVPLSTALATALALGAVGLLYAVALRLFGPVVFQRAVLWIQVATAAMAFGGLQVVAHAVPRSTLLRTLDEPPAWLHAVPPFCFGSLLDVARGELGELRWLGALVALLLPLAVLLGATGLASAHFASALAGQPTSGRPTSGWPRGPLARLAARLGARLCASREERAGFDLARALSRREPLFVRALYPQVIGFTAMGFAMGLLPSETGVLGDYGVLMAFYLLAIVAPGMLEIGQVGSQPPARWVYHLVPHGRRQRALDGATKALFAAGLLPVYLAVTVLVVALRGPALALDAAVAGPASVAVVLRFARRMTLGLPFLGPFRPGQMNTRNLPPVLGMVGAIVALAVVHVLLRVLWAPSLVLAALLGVAWLVLEWRSGAGPRLQRDPDEPPEALGAAPAVKAGAEAGGNAR